LKPAYVDASALIAVAFGESGATTLERRIAGFDGLYSSNLTEAEVLSALVREGREAPERDPFGRISWILPDRPLTDEIARALAAGHLRGADLWHVACALYLSPDPADLAFLTLDRDQRKIGAKLGFST
jgi:predicted nucleic acid-binding protein